MTVWLGMDPEFQVLDKNKKPVLAHEVGFEQKKGETFMSAFRDGANVEINTEANTCRESLSSYFVNSLEFAKSKLPAGYTIGAQAAWPVTLKQVRSAPPDVREFGCKPSRDAYTGETKIPALDGSTHKRRYAGGHLHMSVQNVAPEVFFKTTGREMGVNDRNLWDSLIDPLGQRKYVKLLDWFIGLPCTFIWDDDGQFQRRKWYGQAGEYRSHFYGKAKEDKDGNNRFPYAGVEYRVPPPQLFNHNAPLTLMFGVARHIAMNFAHYSARWDSEMASKEEALHMAINKGKGVEALLTPVPGWYSLENLAKLKVKPEMHQFDLSRSSATSSMGWAYYTGNVWGWKTEPYSPNLY